jgi:transcriptional regulator with XRE-family HTH domain
MGPTPGINPTEHVGIGDRGSVARQRRGWSREALAFHSGVSWSGITQVERGRRVNVRPATLSALARALGVSIDYLVDGAPTRPMLEHRALLYETDEQCVEATAAFVHEGIELGERAIVVMAPARVEMLRDALRSRAPDVQFADRSLWYGTPASALENYRRFVDAQLEERARWVRIVGEPAWTGMTGAEIRLWTRYESLLNIVFAASPVSILCPYDSRTLRAQVLRGARVTHSHAIEHATLVACDDYADPASFALER